MKESRRTLTNVIIVVVMALLASGVFALVSGERGWLKFISWAIFFAAILSPFSYAKDSGLNCFAFSRSKKRD